MPDDQPIQSPGDFIRQELTGRGWTQADLAKIVDRPLPTLNRILNGKHAILPDMAIALGMAFGNGPEVWMQREAAYRLSLADRPVDESVRRRARLFEIIPVKEIQRREWISDTDDLDALEREVCNFIGAKSLDDVKLEVATRRSSAGEVLTPQQFAWCCRAKQLASALPVAKFDPKNLDKCAAELKQLFAFPEQARKVPSLFGKYGIRFLVIEPLAGGKIDGVACWLSAEKPVIAVSLRFDRIDAFWFTLAHEFAHIKHGDALSVDTDLAGEDQSPSAAKNDIERRADDYASDLLVPQDILDSFVARVSPLYSKARIIQLAHRIKVHPGIIVGQLQYRGEIGYRANREMLLKVREIIADSAVTDGWGHTVSLGVTDEASA